MEPKSMLMKQKSQEGATLERKAGINSGVLSIGIQDISTLHYTALILRIWLMELNL